MANINDYLLWRGDIPINRNFRFNEIDSLILARFSYLRFDKIKMKKVETIESISKKMKDLDNEEFRYNGDKELITYLGQSERFKNMKVTDYVQNNEKEIEQQFGAITIHISSKEIYVSYIGTDSTIYGWKEDFNTSFMDTVPCQIVGKKYFQKISRKYPDRKIRVGGHSKGGNVAIYSAITAPIDIKNRIIKIYNYDGPGFNKKIINKYKTSALLKKIETYLPQDSVIGQIMEHIERCTVVYSLEKGIYQHDIYSWQVFKDDLIKSENVSTSSEIMNQTLNDWLANTTAEQRKFFFDQIFEIFYSTEANTFGEISKNLSKNVVTMLKSYKDIDEEDRKTIMGMLKLFTKAYIHIAKEKEKIIFNNKKEYFITEKKKKLKGKLKIKKNNMGKK